MKKTVIGLCVMLMMGACQQPVNHHGRTPMAELNGEYLYLEDFQSVTPAGFSSEDSALGQKMFCFLQRLNRIFLTTMS